MFIPKYPNFIVVEFDRLVYEEIKRYGNQIDNLYIEACMYILLSVELYLVDFG